MNKSFDDFIKEIDLGAYLESQGYSLDQSKSAKSSKTGWMVYDLKDNNSLTLETLLVKLNRVNSSPYFGQYYYYNTKDAKDRGNILHFLCSRRGWTFKENADELTKELSKIAGAPIPDHILKREKANTASNEERNEVIAKYWELKPLKDRSFLHYRGISDDTIDSALFKNKIFHNEVEVGKGERKLKFFNTCFPMVTEKGDLVCLETKNKNFSGMPPESSRSNSLWFSNFDRDKPLDNLIVGESAVDMLSHYQLNFVRLQNKNILYVSTGGQLSQEQIPLIERIYNKLSPLDGIILANDNDNAGIRYNIQLMSAINTKSGDNSIKFELSSNGKYNYTLAILMQGDSISLKERISKMENTFNKFNNMENRFDIVHRAVNSNSASIQMEVQGALVNLKTIEKILKTEKGLENEFKVERAANKDFNDDLREKLGIAIPKKTMNEAKEVNNIIKKESDRNLL